MFFSDVAVTVKTKHIVIQSRKKMFIIKIENTF